MKTSRFLFIACFLAGTSNLALASDSVYVCSIHVDTGFAKLTDTGFPLSTRLRIKAELTSKPYCEGKAAGVVDMSTPVLEQVRSRKKVYDHTTAVRNNWQAALSSLQVLAIAAAHGSPLDRGQVVAVNVEEQPTREFAFQSTRAASTNTRARTLPTGKSGNTSRGYVCFSNSKYHLIDPNQMLTASSIQNFEVMLYSEPYCLGKRVADHRYEFGPPLRLRGNSQAKLFQITATMNASALMHALYTTFVGAAMSGQHITVTHTDSGLIQSVEIKAQPRNLAREVKTIATPGQ